MQIGINIANHRDLLSKRYIYDTARMAEDLGFDSVWIPDHHDMAHFRWEIETLAAHVLPQAH
jgi:alkanesulfonate monooxygenase SsuD/methylene tetrahydromethanopterin reductase-like flavin-dependent oxidoreductase (luciferase family)